MRHGTPNEVATEESVNTRFGVERVVRDAFARGVRAAAQEADAGAQDQRARPRRVVVAADGRRGRSPTSRTSPSTTPTSMPPACTSSTQPQRFDVVVTDNLFGDIVTDLGAAIAGGIGLAASGNLNVDGTAPSMFEPVHGSAPDIAGSGHRRSDCDRAVGRNAARLARSSGTPRSGSRRPRRPISPSGALQRSGVRSTSDIGDAITARLA